jgi:uncharacterized protein (TIGR02145 family)
MKTKINLFIISLLLSQNGLIAKTVDTLDAKIVARNVYFESFSTKKKLSFNEVNPKLIYTKIVENDPIYYVFQLNVNDGFVIIAADDNAFPILGFTDKGIFELDEENQPPAFAYWMQYYTDQLMLIKQKNKSRGKNIFDSWNDYKNTNFAPDVVLDKLLPLNTHWNQNQYYNTLCPQTGINGHPQGYPTYNDHVPTGCVATAMAQIMRYWEYPIHGQGSHTYIDLSNPAGVPPCDQEDPSYEISPVNFGNANYSWANMPNEVEEANNDIATLMYHCGVSVDMNYCYCGSGATTLAARNAFIDYFKYNEGAELIDRDIYAYDWETLLINEINSERPLFYQGVNNETIPGFQKGAHAFICYGWQVQGTNKWFRFNWGWGNSQYDGYYYVGPVGSPSLPYNTSQAIISNLQPLPDLTVMNTSIYPENVQPTHTFSITCTVKNLSKGNDETGSLLKYYLSPDEAFNGGDQYLGSYSVQALTGNTETTVTCSLAIPFSSTPGSYYVLCFADADNTVAEYNENNNITPHPITIIPLPAFIANGQVTPPQGNTSTNFVFSVYYCDPNNQAPQYVKVIGSGWSPNMSGDGTDYSSGVMFSTVNMIFPVHGTYTYYFEAKTALGQIIRWPSASDLTLNVAQYAEGWDLRVTYLTVSPSYLINGGNVTATATVHNNSNSPDKIYTNVPYKFEMISPSGDVIDQETGIISSLEQLSSVNITKTLTTGTTEGQYNITFQVSPIVDEIAENNSMTKPVIVGEAGPSHEFYINSDFHNVEMPEGTIVDFNEHSYEMLQHLSEKVIIRQDENPQRDIFSRQTREYNSNVDVLINEFCDDYGAYISFGTVSTDYVTFTYTNITCLPGETIYFEGNCSGEQFGVGSADIYNNTTIDPWHVDTELSNSNHTCKWYFDIPANAVPDAYEFELATRFEEGGKFLSELKITVLPLPPFINSLSSTSISADDQITISGTSFGTAMGTVKFYNNINGTVINWSDTQIECTVPNGVQTGNVIVINSAGTSNGIYYQVISSTGDPEIVQHIPNQTMNQNASLVVANLNNTFWDPNNDPLQFNIISSSPNISYALANNELSLTTNNLAQGINQIIVSATDLTNMTVNDTFLISINLPYPYINIIEPYYSVTWNAGTLHTIRWITNINVNVKIELYKGGTFDSQIASSVSGNSYDWTIPASQIGATNYRIKITSTDNSNVYCFSENYVTILDRGIRLNLKAFLEGPYAAPQMMSLLNLNNYIPLHQPYDTLPWGYYGNENVLSIPNSDIIDWVLVELRETDGNASTATTDKVKMRQAGFIYKDGNISSVNIENTLWFDLNLTQNLYVAIFHRNHLGILSAYSLTSSGNEYFYDFTNSIDKTFNGELAQKELSPGVFGMISADGDANGIIDLNDKDIVWDKMAGISGYKEGDFNLNGQVENVDKNEYWHPNIGDTAQTSIEPCVSFIDNRDGRVYRTVTIGNQCWMAENLNIGMMIPVDQDQLTNTIIEKYCYNDNSENCEVYGGLYQWNEMMQYRTNPGVQGICPIGWHVPSLEEWMTITEYLGGEDLAGGKMKSTGTIEEGNGLWYAPNAGANNISGFTGLPAGSCGGWVGYEAWFWSSTQFNCPLYQEKNHETANNSENNLSINEFEIPCGEARGLLYDSESLYWDRMVKDNSHSVRCVMGEPINHAPTQPSDPMPGNGSLDVFIYPTISWNCYDIDGDTLTYDVYFGLENPPPLILSGNTINSYKPGMLVYDTNYYWKIIVFDGHDHTIDGPVWSFRTMQPGQCGDTIVDNRDGQIYNIIQIGGQCWMAQNLNFESVESRCYSDNLANCNIYGRLYDWETMMNGSSSSNSVPSGVQGICPSGWHIPSDGEWCIATQYIDSTVDCNSYYYFTGTDVGTKMKSKTGWNSNGNGSNESMFTALPGGFEFEGFEQLGYFTFFWSSTGFYANDAMSWGLSDSETGISIIDFYKWNKLSVRCINDDILNQSPYQPSNPLPENGTTNISINPEISWHCTDPDDDPLTYDIYFGIIDPPPMVINGQTINSYEPGLLDYNTNYFWKIVVNDDHGNIVESPVWSFNTIQPGQCGDTIVDIRDEQIYNTVQIGGQCWMAENLNIGNEIPGGQDMANNEIIEKYCYNDDTENCQINGGLFQWNEVMQYTTQPGIQGICPNGWHIPTFNEWTGLINFLGGTEVAGGKMKSTGTIEAGNGLWYDPNLASNSSGFSALPSAYRYPWDNTFFWDLGYVADFWVSNETMILELWNDWEGADIYTYDIIVGASVRCLKDGN